MDNINELSWRDSLLLREMERFQAAAPNSETGPRAPLPEYDTVPVCTYDALAQAHQMLEHECSQAYVQARQAKEAYAVMYRECEHRSGLWKQAVRDLARARRGFWLASAMSAVMTVGFWLAWLRII